MPRAFRKGIACHGSMQTPPFSPESFVALNIDAIQKENFQKYNVKNHGSHRYFLKEKYHTFQSYLKQLLYF